MLAPPIGPPCAGRGWALATRVHAHECADCRKQTSVTAGTVMHGSRLALTLWFRAACLMATHANGIAALHLQKQRGRGSCKTAWLLEVDESLISCRSRDDPASGGRRSHYGKLLIAGAVGEGGAGRIRLAQIENVSSNSPHAFLDANRATARTDGGAGDSGASGVTHDPHVVGNRAAPVVLPWGHRVFANLKTWALGVYHGRRQHLQSDLDEVVFRFNRRRTRHAAFRTILGIGVAITPAIYKMFITPELQR